MNNGSLKLSIENTINDASAFISADQFHKTVKLQNSDFVVAALGKIVKVIIL